jgi:hypothetical protein
MTGRLLAELGLRVSVCATVGAALGGAVTAFLAAIFVGA